MRQIKIYTASKLRHADFIKSQRMDGFHFCARWLDYVNDRTPVSHWMDNNFTDIRSSDAVLIYGEEADHLKTALVDAGYAIACGKPVYVIGAHPDYHPWCYFVPYVKRAATFEQALKEIRQGIETRVKAV